MRRQIPLALLLLLLCLAGRLAAAQVGRRQGGRFPALGGYRAGGRSLGRGLRQIDFAQRSGIPTSNPTITGSSNTANYFSSTPGSLRR
jgi:hypothetical protein